jgi:hypothetical protein
LATAFLCLIFVPFGVFCLIQTLVFIGRDEYPSALVAFGSAAFSLGLVAMLAIVALRKVTPRIVSDDEGLVCVPHATRRAGHFSAAQQ